MPFGRAKEHAYSDAERIRYWWSAERERLVDALEALAPSRRREPIAAGGWSPHDILAHRVFWEAQEREAFEQYLKGQTPGLLEFPVERIEAANSAAVEALQERETAALLRALARLRTSSEQLVAQISDGDLDTTHNPARILLGVALEHDREHRGEIENFREGE